MPDRVKEGSGAVASDGRQIVAEWLMSLWIKRPEWLTRMPDQADVDDLVARIDAARTPERKGGGA